MKGIFVNILSASILLNLFLLFPNKTLATHTAGIELFYRHVQDSTYQFTVIFYRNCQGFTATPPTSTSVIYRAPSIGYTATNNTFLCSMLPTSGTGVPPLEPPNLYNCTQAQSSLCYEEYYYRGNWTSPRRANDWIFSTWLCCRPGPPPFTNAPTNIAYDELFIECGLNNLDFPDFKSKNWSPLWHNRRPNHPGYLQDTIINYEYKFLCTGQYYSLDQSAVEYQGDSLSYRFYWPQGTNGNKVAYINSCSFTYPLPTYNGKLTINPSTGIIPVIPGAPTGTGIYILGIEVKEFRNDTTITPSGTIIQSKLIGYNRRELTIFINDSTNCVKDSAHIKDIYLSEIPADSILHVSFNNGNTNAPNSLLRCQSLSKDGSEFRVVDSSNYVAPFDSTVRIIPVIGATWSCYGGFTNQVNLKLGDRLSCGDYYIFLKTGTDLDVIESECGYWEPEFSAAKIHTDSVSPPNIGPDLVGCTNKLFAKTLDAGKNYHRYYWNTYDTTRVISASYVGTFWVKVSNQFECEATDTLEITGEFCNSQGPSGKPNPFNLGINGSAALDEGVRIYPNPTSGLVNVQVDRNQVGAGVSVRNLNGEIVFSTTLTDTESQIDLSALETGIYLFEFTSEEGELSHQKIVVK